MSYYRPPRGFLLVPENPEDAARIAEAIGNGAVAYQQIVGNLFFGFCFGRAQENYRILQQAAGVRGKIQWLELSSVEVTGGEEATGQRQP